MNINVTPRVFFGEPHPFTALDPGLITMGGPFPTVLRKECPRWMMCRSFSMALLGFAGHIYIFNRSSESTTITNYHPEVMTTQTSSFLDIFTLIYTYYVSKIETRLSKSGES